MNKNNDQNKNRILLYLFIYRKNGKKYQSNCVRFLKMIIDEIFQRENQKYFEMRSIQKWHQILNQSSGSREKDEKQKNTKN